MKRLVVAGLAISLLLAGAASGAAPLPLTFRNVRTFFSDTLRIRPTEVQKKCAIFYEGEWINPKDYNYCVIIVENSDEDLQVTFYLTDDREMNWVNEFLDGPFFTPAETENLFRLLHRKQHARSERVGRFRVELSHWEPKHAQIIVVSFSP
ncbi:MAG TPA: hypothetical protein VGL24_07680 [Chthoniobacterales bacterium]